MKAKRVIFIILAALLLVSGCSRRTLPLSPAETSAPAPETAETAPAPESTAAATPSPTPTPCPHPSWTDGVCDECGAVCPHAEHDPETRLCPVCGEICRHTFLDGVCTVCGAVPVFEERELPEELRGKCPERGTVEEITYTTWIYSGDRRIDGTDVEKKMLVYLPYGYDPAEQYDVLILMHGLGNGESYWLGEPQEYEGKMMSTTDMLDNLIYTGYCGKMIVAAPTFYRNAFNYSTYDPQADAVLFWPELRFDVLPCLAEHYATYAGSGRVEDIAAVREHFGYVGLSMGSIIAYQSLLPYCLDEIGWIGCLSGFGTEPSSMARRICNWDGAAYPIYYLYNGCGSIDAAWQEHKDGYERMLSAIEKLEPGRLEDGKNCCFVEIEYAKHEYKGWIIGLYNCLQIFFTLPEQLAPSPGPGSDRLTGGAA